MKASGRTSAKIYQFPTRARTPRGARFQDGRERVKDPVSVRVSDAAVDANWYHEAAIQETKPVRDH